ncbi:hypothetical protein Tco_1499437, partial [Tanacetum coccineum]
RHGHMASLLSHNKPNPPEAQRPLLEDLSYNYLEDYFNLCVPLYQVSSRCSNSNTSLYLAAASRNMKAAKVMLNKDEPLLNIRRIHRVHHSIWLLCMGGMAIATALFYGIYKSDLPEKGWIVEYTNDEKSTLLRQLPMANILTEDRFFAFQELQEIRAILTKPIGKECRFANGDIFIINPKG